MKCFRHSEVDAVGVCKWCGKGLCGECAVDTGNGLACKDSCEEEVMGLSEFMANEAMQSRKAGITQRYWSGALLLAGLLFFLMEGRRFPGLPTRIVFGVVLLMFSAFAYFNSRD